MPPVERTVRELEQFDGQGGRVLSVYLLTDPSSQPGQNLHAQLDELANGIEQQLNGHAEGIGRLRREVEAVRRAVGALTTPPRSLALFSCTERHFLREIRLPVRVAPAAVWSPAPYLRPLLGALDEFERTLVLLIDKERARLFRVFLGHISEIDDLIEDTPGRHRQIGGAYAYPSSPDWTRGGFADPGIVRHEEAHVHHHAKRAVEALARAVARERADRVLLGGAPEALVEARRLLPRPLRGRLAPDVAHVPLFAAPAEVLTAVQPLIERAERAEEERILDDLIEQAGAGRAVFGVTAVGDAAAAGNVHALVYGADVDRWWLRQRCTGIAAPAPARCSACGDPACTPWPICPLTWPVP
ncbi:MAG: hypothetical protein U0531_09235 [Dehalococcoidia bacterium]